MVGVREGLLGGTLPYIAVGDGPPFVVLSGLSPAHAHPRGLARRFEMQTLAPFAGHFTVYGVNRRPGLSLGTTMHDIADDYARAIAMEFGGAVDAMGISTGGSVALQLVIDHPETIRRLIIASSACRLGPFGRAVQRQVADDVRAGRARRAYGRLGGSVFASAFGRTAGGWVASLVGPRVMGRIEGDDMVVTILAEDAFDAEPDLPRITAPTLVAGGVRDTFYSPELFRLTAERIPNGRLVLYEGKGHVGALAQKQFVRDALAFLGVH